MNHRWRATLLPASVAMTAQLVGCWLLSMVASSHIGQLWIARIHYQWVILPMLAGQ